jgi:AGZA family xanthine/uracil permease-like MFS transporter
MPSMSGLFKNDNAVAGDGKVPWLQPIKRDYVWFQRGDLDSFPALFFDNLSSLLGIFSVMIFVPFIAFFNGATITPAHAIAFGNEVFGRVGPGVAISLAFGNIWYSWMAWKLAGYEDRQDVTALPYGINTPAGFVMAFSVILPLCFKYQAIVDPDEFAFRVWAGACSANFIGGIFEVAGFWLGNLIRNNTTKAALYAPIAAVGFVYLGLAPVIAVGSEPIIGILPLALCFTGFFANKGKGMYKFPAALLIFTIGTVLKWAGAGRYQGSRAAQADAVVSAWNGFAGKNDILPGRSLEGMADAADFISIVFPVALQSFIETMENVEAAAHKGDHYNVMEAMVVDGLGTMVGALFGSTIPTTVYIGHARHKLIGARATYSLLNAATYFVLLMSGIFPTIYSIIDPISIGCILIFVGLMIVQQSFEVSARRHYPALCIGIFMLITDLMKNNSGDTSPGVLNLSAGGGIMASLVITQIVCDLTDARFDRAMVVTFIAILFAEFGIMHGNNAIDINGDSLVQGEVTVSFNENPVYTAGRNEGWRFAVAYSMLFVFCAFHYVGQKYFGWFPPPVLDNGVCDVVPIEKPEEDKEEKMTA